MQWLQDTWQSFSGEYPEQPQAAASDNLPKPAGELQTSISRAQLLTFFQQGEELLRSEATRRRLKDARFLKQDVEELINQLQKELLEKEGIQGEAGLDYLGKVSTIYKEDNEVMAALLRFASLEEDALDEAEMPQAEYEQNKRLMEIAKAHAAQLMSKLDELPPEQRQAFLQDQMLRAEQLRQSMVQGGEPPGSRQIQPGAAGSMSQTDQMSFFKDLQR